MYRNQYIISNTPLQKTFGFEVQSFNYFHVYTHPSLETARAKSEHIEILILGFAIDPFHPKKSNSEIANELAQAGKNKSGLYKRVQDLAGRFVILYKNEDQMLALNDTCGLRQIYYLVDDKIVALSSNQKMLLDCFELPLSMSLVKQAIVNSRRFHEREHVWYSAQGFDDRIFKCLPNHHFDFNTKLPIRTPLFFPEYKGEKEVIEYSAQVLKGTLEATSLRFKPLQAITAGWDTRMLLAASRPIQQNMQYFIFAHMPNHQTHPDVVIARQLAEKLRLNFKVLHPEKPDSDFLNIFTAEHIVPRVLPKTSGIYYHFHHHSHDRFIKVNGNCSTIFKCYFGIGPKPASPQVLSLLTTYFGRYEFFNREIADWFENAKEYAKTNNLSMFDLFNWEFYISNWTTIYPLEQDIAIEEISPFNHKTLCLTLLQVPEKYRATPNYSILRKLIQKMWPEVLNEPINPSPRKRLPFRHLKRYTAFRYIKNRLTAHKYPSV